MRQPKRLQFPKLLQRAARSRPTTSINAAATARGAAGPAPPASGTLHCNAAGGAPRDAGRIAADIGTAALELAKQANGAGLTTLGYLLESAALEAGAEAASSAWPADATEP